MADDANMAVMAALIPALGLPVVGALCHATIPRSGSEERVGSRITPSVFVLMVFCQVSYLVVEEDFTYPPTSTPILKFGAIVC